MPNNNFGRTIRLGRERNGLSQSELAGKLHVSQSLISMWERGRGEPDEKQKKFLDAILALGLASPERRAAGLDGPSIFGAWLSKVRQKRGLTVPEVSGRAGVSIPAIYNIENGKARNPHTRTITALERALGDKFEQEPELKEESEIKGVGSFVDFDPHNERDWPKEPGIYVFYDISERPIYVGQASNIAARLRGHHDRFWFKQPIVENAAYVQVADRELREQIESILIKFLKSNAVLNKQLVERESKSSGG